MLIDALRADFVFHPLALRTIGPEFETVGNRRPRIVELESLLEHADEALGMVAVTTPPTVTLPRLKVK